jgi:hypothetical protein
MAELAEGNRFTKPSDPAAARVFWDQTGQCTNSMKNRMSCPTRNQKSGPELQLLQAAEFIQTSMHSLHSLRALHSLYMCVSRPRDESVTAIQILSTRKFFGQLNAVQASL